MTICEGLSLGSYSISLKHVSIIASIQYCLGGSSIFFLFFKFVLCILVNLLFYIDFRVSFSTFIEEHVVILTEITLNL